MQFSAITISALFAALVSAGPIAERQARGTEPITITDLSVRNINNAIDSASFAVGPDNVSCSASADFDTTLSCDTKGWSFYIKELSLETYNLIVYKQTGDVSGIWGQTNATLTCRAGGSAASDYVCEQSGDVKFNLTP